MCSSPGKFCVLVYKVMWSQLFLWSVISQYQSYGSVVRVRSSKVSAKLMYLVTVVVFLAARDKLAQWGVAWAFDGARISQRNVKGQCSLHHFSKWFVVNFEWRIVPSTEQYTSAWPILWKRSSCVTAISSYTVVKVSSTFILFSRWYSPSHPNMCCLSQRKRGVWPDRYYNSRESASI